MTVNDCKSINELMQLWKQKRGVQIEYKKNNKIIKDEVNHLCRVFISDGIVNEKKWVETTPKIAFILKEAYGDDNGQDWSLVEWLRDMYKNEKTYPAVWRRIAEWTYALKNTTVADIPRFRQLEGNENLTEELIHSIAVVNLKKSNGLSESNNDEIKEYARVDSDEIKKELELLSPDIILCGYTAGMLNHIYDGLLIKKKCDNWYYWIKLFNKEVLLIDYYHPANHYPALVNYYAVANIYQQALKDKN